MVVLWWLLPALLPKCKNWQNRNTEIPYKSSIFQLLISGKAKVCNTSIPGSIPGGTSKMNNTPNLNHNSSIGVLFVFKNLYRKRLFSPFLIFLQSNCEFRNVPNFVRDLKNPNKTDRSSSISFLPYRLHDACNKIPPSHREFDNG